MLNNMLANELKEKQESEYAAAAQEAMKDLDVDYKDHSKDEKVEDYEASKAQDETGQAYESVSKQHSLVNVMKRGSIHSLAATATGLDDLIGASTSLEMASGDVEVLKRYSERIAMEADESEKTAKLEEAQQHAIDRLDIKESSIA